MARDTIAPAKRNHEVVHQVILALLRSCHVTIMTFIYLCTQVR